MFVVFRLRLFCAFCTCIMSFTVVITRLCPRWNLSHICGDVPCFLWSCIANKSPLRCRLKASWTHRITRYPVQRVPPNTHGDFFILVVLWCCFQASFCFVLQRHLRTDRVLFVVNPYSEMVGYTRSDTLAVIRG